MKLSFGIYRLLFLFLTIGLIGACRHHPDVIDDTDDDDNSGGTDTLVIVNPHPCDPDSVYFANTIQPLLVSMCATSDCHDAIAPEEGVQLTDYAHIMNYVEASDLNSSELWDDGIMDDNNPMPPADSPQLTQEQIDQIQTWIMQGALNNSCQEDCNPDQFLYSSNIAPIIDLYCDGCHGGNNPSAGYALGTHALLVEMVQNSNEGFMNCLNGANGAPIMPPNTTGLPDCYKQQLQHWIDAGMPND